MNGPIQFRRAARAEFDQSIDWYEARSRGLGDRFEAAVEAVLLNTVVQPKQFPIVDGNVREAGVEGDPFCIYYR